MIDTDAPFGATVDAEEVTDPFATEEEATAGGRGPRKPAPFISALDGCYVAMVPRAFTRLHPVHKDYRKNEGDTQDRYNADVILLATPDGGAFTFQAPDPEFTGEGTAPMKDFVVTPDMLPETWERRYVLEQSMIGQLRKSLAAGKFIVTGVIRKGPQAKDAANGATFETIAADTEKWLRGGGKGKAPRFSWQLDVRMTAEQIKLRNAWYASVKDTIKLGPVFDLDAKRDQ